VTGVIAPVPSASGGEWHEFRTVADDGAVLSARRWDPPARPRAVIQIAHGAAEHLGRYERLAALLVKNGYAVAGADHRGHGANLALHGRGSFGPRGFPGIVEDIATINRAVRRHHGGLPVILFGHSMGSFAAQVFLARHAALLDALILAGTAALDLVLARSDPAGGLAAANARFEPARTAFDWLSRDEAEVDAYIADPLCGSDLEPASVATMPAAIAGTRSAESLSTAVSRQPPVLVLSGEADPIVGDQQVYARAVVDSYRAAGLSDVTHRVYPDARHDLLHETNSEEVMRDIVEWLGSRFSG
jgi:alpha-beta hydrolase superfamily lysophospholipase